MNNDLKSALDMVACEISSMTEGELHAKLKEHKNSEFAIMVQRMYNIANGEPVSNEFTQILNDDILDLF